jgi:hypothetical protein
MTPVIRDYRQHRKTTDPTKSRKSIDWEKIEREYTLGTHSIHQLAEIYDVHAKEIARRAKLDNWLRSLEGEVHTKTQEALAQSDDFITPRDIEIVVARNVAVVRSHRVAIRSALEIIEKLWAELNEWTEGRNDIQETIDELTAQDETDKRRRNLMRAVSLTARSVAARQLASCLQVLVCLERKSFNIGDAGSIGEDTTDASENEGIVYLDAIDAES